MAQDKDDLLLWTYGTRQTSYLFFSSESKPSLDQWHKTAGNVEDLWSFWLGRFYAA